MRRDHERKRFLKRLERERPQPPDEFVSAMAGRLAPKRSHRARGWQVAFAGGLTTLLVLAFAMTGGIGYAASAVKDGTTAVTTLVAGSSTADKADKPQNATQVNGASNQSGSNASSANSNTTTERGNQQSSAREQYEEKVVICHIPPGQPENAHTISVSPNAVPAHLAHGDSLGPCTNGR